MTETRFIQIHWLTSYHASLLNRDDAGLAKRIPFGDTVRTRISSQCLKRHWRTANDTYALKTALGDDGAEAMSVRSRRSFEKYVFRPLVDEDKIPEDVASEITASIMKIVLGESEKAKATKRGQKEEKERQTLETNQVTVLGRRELEFIRTQARECAKEFLKGKTKNDDEEVEKIIKKHFDREALENLGALAAGLDAAMFGRMVTSDYLARVDAAIHVAHAFTVHAEQTEGDYFSAVDDLKSGAAELGSGHINTTELTTGLFYGYAVIDCPLLVGNLGDDRDLAAELTRRMVHLIATVSPGAKLGSTAPYSYAHLMLIEAGNSQPRTLANAFLSAVNPRPDLLSNTYNALARHLGELDRAYGRCEPRRALVLGPKEHLESVLEPGEFSASLGDLADWASSLFNAGGAS